MTKPITPPVQPRKPDQTKGKKKEKRTRVYVDIGSHGGVFMFESGPVGNLYPTLLHVYRRKITPDLKRATLIYKYD